MPDNPPSENEVGDNAVSIPLQLDLGHATEVTRTSDETPVQEYQPMTGNEKAGVELTWGVLKLLAGVLVVFCVCILGIEIAISLPEMPNVTNLDLSKTENLATYNALMDRYESAAKEARAHWSELLKVIVVNVLFPTLTALLGYVFGTTRNNNSGSDNG